MARYDSEEEVESKGLWSKRFSPEEMFWKAFLKNCTRCPSILSRGEECRKVHCHTYVKLSSIVKEVGKKKLKSNLCPIIFE